MVVSYLILPPGWVSLMDPGDGLPRAAIGGPPTRTTALHPGLILVGQPALPPTRSLVLSIPSLLPTGVPRQALMFFYSFLNCLLFM